MMIDGSDGHDEITQGIYQGEIRPSLESRARTQFKPWHKPRKHFLRLNQWCHETRKLLKQIKTDEGGELRYFGLPGEDLLDIRVLKGVCDRAKIKLRYLGFDSSLTSTQLNLSRHEVNSGEYIHPSSVVIADRLEKLGATDTIACQYVEKHAPFDVINLDLCDSVTALSKDGVIPNLEAIRTLCDIQIKRRGQPWLFFLTTRAIREELDSKTTERLFEQLFRNTKDNEFSSSLNDKLGLSEVAIRTLCDATQKLNNESWLRAYVLALGKWLLHYMMANKHTVMVQMLPSYTYSVKRGTKDMASLAFYLNPNSEERNDDTGLTQPRAIKVSTQSEVELARRIIDQVAALEDLDGKIQSDAELKKSMFKKCAALLSTLRYDLTAYEKFAFAD